MERRLRKVKWSDGALYDLRLIVKYLTIRESKEFANNKARIIASAASRLSHQAFLWRIRENIYPSARFLLIEPYVIVYDVRNDVINIARVVHGAQNIEAIFQTEDDPRL